jgi:hypothetical protein
MSSGNRVCFGISLMVAAAVLVGAVASASIPRKINYQARLVANGTGLPLTGPIMRRSGSMTLPKVGRSSGRSRSR